jgi:competence ComEA-like helix-hairpin-helix protein
MTEPKAQIMALEQDLERERKRAAKSLEEVQRRAEEAGARITVTDARAPGTELIAERTEEQLEIEMRRLQAESDEKIEAALGKVEAGTRARVQQEAERRLAEQQEEINALRAQLDQERGLRDERIQEAERHAERAEAKAEAAEQDRLNAEAGAKAAAAEWVRGQTRAMQREVEEKGQSKQPAPSEGALDLNRATFEELRELGMSLTQATRVIAYREREGGFSSPDELARVPGISKKFLSRIGGQLTAAPS